MCGKEKFILFKRRKKISKVNPVPGKTVLHRRSMSKVYTMTKLALPADTDREAFGDLVTKRLKCIQFSNRSPNRSKYNRSIDSYQLIISYKRM